MLDRVRQANRLPSIVSASLSKSSEDSAMNFAAAMPESNSLDSND